MQGQRKSEAVRSGIVRLLLALALLWSGAGAAVGDAAAKEPGGAEAAAGGSLRAEVAGAVAGLQRALGAGGEPLSDWAAFALARSGAPAAERYLPDAARRADAGELRLVTDLARMALAVNANGGDPADVGGRHVNLLERIARHERMTAQGPNGPAFALIAWDAADYEPPGDAAWSRDALIGWLLDHRNADGGWSLTPGASDADWTAIVLTALSPYRDRAEVAEAVEAGLTWLSDAQRADGGFGTPGETSESTAQVLIALTALGIDPERDARFVKEGGHALSRLLAYRLADGRFAHVAGGQADGMATFHALLGLAAVERYWDGLPGLYAGVPSAGKTEVEVYGPSGRIAGGAAAGRTALEALVGVLEAQNVPYVVKLDPTFGPMLQTVSGFENGRLGGYDGWMYAVRRDDAWAPIAEGMGSFRLQAGDRLFVYYGDGDTAPIHSVKLEPAAPRAGQPFTVIVEKETLDWETGQPVVGPAAGASVLVGGAAVVADEQGRASVADGLAAGEYALTVDGYRSGGAPLYVPWQTVVAVETYEKRVAVSVEGPSGTVAAMDARAGTALEAVERTLTEAKIAYEVKKYDFGSSLEAVAGTASGAFGGYDGWLYAVQRDGGWIVPAQSMDTFLLEDGDEVVVYYGDGETKLLDLAVEPAGGTLRPHEPFTVQVSYRDWDWEKNAFGETKPLAGVRVATGVLEAVTDEAGTATFAAGLSEGAHALTATAYVSEGAPRAVRADVTVAVAASYADEKAVSAWALEAVRLSRASGLLRGPGDGGETFSPQRQATRAELVSAIVRAIGLTGAGGGAGAAAVEPFADVRPDAWYAEDVRAARAAGLVDGVGGGKFAPDAAVTREQAALILTRALGLAAVRQAELRDGGTVSPAARSAVDAVIGAGWMTAYEGRFAPKAALTREQAAVIAARLYAEPGIGAAAAR